MINKQQLFTLFLGLILLTIALSYQPYFYGREWANEEFYQFFRYTPPERANNGDQIFFDSSQYAFQIGFVIWFNLIAMIQFRSLNNPEQDLTAKLSENSIFNLKKNLRRKNVYVLTWVGVIGLFTLECFSWNTSRSIPIIFTNPLLILIACVLLLLVQSVAFKFMSRYKL